MTDKKLLSDALDCHADHVPYLKELVLKLVESDPEKRITAPDAYCHQYFIASRASELEVAQVGGAPQSLIEEFMSFRISLGRFARLPNRMVRDFDQVML